MIDSSMCPIASRVCSNSVTQPIGKHQANGGKKKTSQWLWGRGLSDRELGGVFGGNWRERVECKHGSHRGQHYFFVGTAIPGTVK